MNIQRALRKCKTNAKYSLQEINMRKDGKNWAHGVDRSKNPTINNVIDWCSICGYEVIIRKKGINNSQSTMIINEKCK